MKIVVLLAILGTQIDAYNLSDLPSRRELQKSEKDRTSIGGYKPEDGQLIEEDEQAMYMLIGILLGACCIGCIVCKVVSVCRKDKSARVFEVMSREKNAKRRQQLAASVEMEQNPGFGRMNTRTKSTDTSYINKDGQKEKRPWF